MSLTFPRPFPMHGVFTDPVLDLVRRQAMGEQASGSDIPIDRGAPKWTAHYVTRGLTNAETGAWDAWKASLRGAARYFLGYDPLREYPLAYMPAGWPAGMTRAGGGAWNGIGVLHAIATIPSGDGQPMQQATVWTLPAGLIMQGGDKIACHWTNADSLDRYSLHMVTDEAPVMADSSGHIALTVEPEFPSDLVTGCDVILYRAPAKLRMLSCDITKSGSGGARPGQVTLDAMSVNI